MISIIEIPIERAHTKPNVLLGFSWTLLAAGVLLLAYSGYVIGDAFAYQRLEALKFNTPKVVNTPEHLRKNPPQPAIGEVVGELQIPRIGLKVIVVEGDSTKALRRAAGHIPNTALPGEPGNVVLAGHRDSFFRPLAKIRQGDRVTLNLPDQQFIYEVQSMQVVSPRDVSVLRRTTDRELTLITCYPFGYIGPAPNRFVVRAREIEPHVSSRE